LFAHEVRPLLAGRATGHLAAIRAQLGWLETALVRAVSMLLRDPKVPGVEPVDLELCIGVSQPSGEPPEYASVPMHLAHEGAERTLYIGGIIDRVDEGTGGRVVIDYKTASTSSIRRKAAKDALFEKHFQLLLYLRLMEHHRPSAQRVPLHGYLVSLREGTTSDDVGEVPSLRERVVDDAREDSLAAAVGRVVMPVLQGVLPPDAGDRCDECRLQRLCRVPLIAELSPDLDDNEDGGAA
jgi:CRISPR/Cas system-associated exonuclease Cas4 (RecB family)